MQTQHAAPPSTACLRSFTLPFALCVTGWPAAARQKAACSVATPLPLPRGPAPSCCLPASAAALLTSSCLAFRRGTRPRDRCNRLTTCVDKALQGTCKKQQTHSRRAGGGRQRSGSSGRAAEARCGRGRHPPPVISELCGEQQRGTVVGRQRRPWPCCATCSCPCRSVLQVRRWGGGVTGAVPGARRQDWQRQRAAARKQRFSRCAATRVLCR